VRVRVRVCRPLRAPFAVANSAALPRGPDLTRCGGVGLRTMIVNAPDRRIQLRAAEELPFSLHAALAAGARRVS